MSAPGTSTNNANGSNSNNSSNSSNNSQPATNSSNPSGAVKNTKPEKEIDKEPKKDTKDAKELKETKEANAKDTKQVKQILQVGVYTDPAKIKEYRARLEKAGFKTTTPFVTMKDGTKRIRLRVGPFKNYEEAQKMLDKVRELKIPGAQLNIIPAP
jgi:cell division protein FtsN